MTNPWRDLCQRLVLEVLRRRDWQLIPDDALSDFVEQVHQAIIKGIIQPRPNAPPEATVRRATIHLYCHELYRASGEKGTLRQRRAFEEIGRHAQGVAFRYEQTQAVVQVCVQRALAIIWEKHSQVRNPGSFLRWVETIVYHEVKGYWKEKHRKQEISMSNLTPADDSDVDDESLQHFWETLASIPPPDDDQVVLGVIGQELREQLWAEVQRVLGGNARYEAVIVGYYLYELSLPVLAETLQMSVRNVYVLKSRALARLRADQDFIRQFADALETLPGGKP